MSFMSQVEVAKGADLQIVNKARNTFDADLLHRDGEPVADWEKRVLAVKVKDYEEVNGRIKELLKQLLPGAMELQRLCWRMKEEKLFLAAEYKTYPDWVAGELHLGRSVGYEYAHGGRIYQLIEKSDASDSPPTNPHQLKPLLNEEDDKKVVKIWKKAVELAKLEPDGGGITSAVVTKARKMLYPPAKPAPEKEAVARTGSVARSGWAWFNPEGCVLWATINPTKQESDKRFKWGQGDGHTTPTLDELRDKGYVGCRIRVVPIGEDGDAAPDKPASSKPKPEPKPAKNQKAKHTPALPSLAALARPLHEARQVITSDWQSRLTLIVDVDEGLKPTYWQSLWDRSPRDLKLQHFRQLSMFSIFDHLEAEGEIETEKGGRSQLLWKHRLTAQGLAAKKSDDAEKAEQERQRRQPAQEPAPKPEQQPEPLNPLGCLVRHLLSTKKWSPRDGIVSDIQHRLGTQSIHIESTDAAQAIDDLTKSGEVETNQHGSRESGKWEHRLTAKGEAARDAGMRLDSLLMTALKKPEHNPWMAIHSRAPEQEPDAKPTGPTAESVLTAVVERLDEIAAGIEEQVSNMPDSMQGGEKADALGEVQGAVTEVKDSLEAFVEGLMESGLDETPVKGVPKLIGGSRGKQVDRCQLIMEKVVDLLPAKDADGEELASSLHDIAEELSNVEFP